MKVGGNVRTNSAAVTAILGQNYDSGSESRDPVDLTPYMETASSLIDQVVACATRKGVVISSTQTELMERWMSGYYYTQMDPLYKSRSTLGASGAFAEQSYKEAAVDMDPSGCLNALLKRQRARIEWVGKTPDEREADQGEGL